MNKKTLTFLLVLASPIALLIGLISCASLFQAKFLNDCNTGDLEACKNVTSDSKQKITNINYLKRLEEEKILKQKADEETKEKRKKSDLEKRIKAQAQADAEAAFKAEGWWEAEQGIFVRWCENQCADTESFMDSVWRMEVWCKERACGDIYARINIMNGSNGPVIGWTNETAYGDIGQKVILTFQSSTSGSASLTEFTARGQ